MANKEIKFGNDARTRIKDGIDRAAAAVSPTLGAVGMSAIIQFPGLDPVECDDGVTILKNLEFKDPYENLGLQKIRKAAVRTSQEGGDGTATTTVLTQALVSEAFREIANDSSKIREVRERLSRGLEETLEQLRMLKRDVEEEDIERIATISSLDPEVSKVIAEIIKEVGVNGVVTVEKGSKIGYTKEVVKGARFERGMISPYFMNDREKGQTVLENPYIVVVDRKISTNEQIKSLMGSIFESGNKSVLFIADDVDGMALATLIKNNSTVVSVNQDGSQTVGAYQIACVRNPYNSSRATDFLLDMAALTGATMISEQAGMRLDNATIDLCGMSDKVIVTKDTTTIIGGKSNDRLAERIKLIEKQIEETTSDYEKLQLEERLAQLTGGIGVIRVGAYTDTEFNSKKYKFENAVNATQAALQEGILPGGGVALYNVASKVNDKIFQVALTTPIHQMAKNAGYVWNEAPTPTNKETLLASNIEGWGFDARKGHVCNMFDEGIIDPFKVTRLALESAVAITSSLINIETVIVEEKNEDKISS